MTDGTEVTSFVKFAHQGTLLGQEGPPQCAVPAAGLGPDLPVDMPIRGERPTPQPGDQSQPGAGDPGRQAPRHKRAHRTRARRGQQPVPAVHASRAHARSGFARPRLSRRRAAEYASTRRRLPPGCSRQRPPRRPASWPGPGRSPPSRPTREGGVTLAGQPRPGQFGRDPRLVGAASATSAAAFRQRAVQAIRGSAADARPSPPRQGLPPSPRRRPQPPPRPGRDFIMMHRGSAVRTDVDRRPFSVAVAAAGRAGRDRPRGRG